MSPEKAKPVKHTYFFLRFWIWLKNDFFGIFWEMRWSYLPPLMVYLAAGISGFTGIIESFFVKQELGLSAAFLAGLAFWAGLPWALKMPLGHLVDLFWRRKALFVYLGATLMALSLFIMIGLTGYTQWMSNILPAEIWYIISVSACTSRFKPWDASPLSAAVHWLPVWADGWPPSTPTSSCTGCLCLFPLSRLRVWCLAG
jgi:hypothetical protein